MLIRGISWVLIAGLVASQVPAAEILTPRGATWKFYDQGSEPVGWKLPAFNDAAWQEGPGPLGYGDNDESTVVGYGPSTSNRYITTYFRRSIEVPAGVANETKVTLELQRDDGAIIYLDGVEIARSNMPAGPVLFSTLAASTVSNADEDTYFPIALDPSVFTEGTHVLAAEVHQRTADSSDLSFDLAITYGVEHPGAIDYTPDAVEMDRNGIVYLLESAAGQLHRWSVPLGSYLESLPITPGAIRFTYSPQHNAFYTGYANGTIRVLRLGVATPLETAFANVGTTPDLMLGTSSALFVANGTTYRFFSDTGTLLATRSGTALTHAVWDSIGSRLIYYPKPNQNQASSRVLLPDFSLQAALNVNADRLPLRTSPDGSLIVSGYGRILATTTPITAAGALATTSLDMAWSGNDTLFTLNQGPTATDSELRKWSGPTRAETVRLPLAGAPLRIFSHAGAAVLVTQQNGRPKVRVFDGNLVEQDISETLPPDAGSLKIPTRAHTSLTLTWSGSFPQTENFLVQYRAEGATLWSSAPLLPGTARTTTLTGLQPLSLYQLRYRALNAIGGGEYSQTSTARTLETAATPLGSPYSIDVVRVTHNEIELEWNDNADNETGFRIYRNSDSVRPATAHVTLPANQTTFTDTGLPPSTLYYYWVEAFNGATGGEISSPDSATTAASASPPRAVSTLVAVSEEEPGRLRVTWQDFWTNEQGFILQRRTRGGIEPFAEVARTGPNETVAYDETAQPTVSYEYVVTVFNAEGTFQFPNITTFIVPGLGGTYLYHEAKVAGVQYFAFKNPNRIERFDLQTDQWLSPIPTVDEITGLAPGTGVLYVAENRKLSRLLADGSFFHLLNQPSQIRGTDLFAIAGNILLVAGQTFTSYDGITGAPVETVSIPGNLSLSRYRGHPSSRSLYANGSSPTLTAVRFRPDGTFDHTDTIAGAVALNDFVVSPDETTAISRSNGVVLSLPGGEITGSVGSAFSHDDFTAGGDLVLARGGSLYVFDGNSKPIGLRYFDRNLTAVSTSGNTTAVFNLDGKNPHGMAAETLSLAGLGFPAPGPPLDSHALSLVTVPTETLVDNNGLLFLYTTDLPALFRWSPSERRYLESIPLLQAPAKVIYLPAHHRIYVAYPSGLVSMIDLATGATETPLFASPSTNLIAAGSHLYAGGWIYDREGVLTEATGNVITSGVWVPSSRRLLGGGDGISFWMDFSPSGLVTASGSLPGASLSDPVLNADGTRVLSGVSILSPSTFTSFGALGRSRTKAAWSGSSVYTIKTDSQEDPFLLRWDGTSSYKLTAFANASGTPLGLYDVPAGILLVALDNYRPRFSLYHRSTLALLHHSEGPPPIPPAPRISARESDGFLLDFARPLALPSILEYRQGSSDPWLFVVALPAGGTSYRMQGLAPDTTYRFRFRVVGEVYETNSQELRVATTASPTAAGGEPYTLRREATSLTTVSLRWDDTTATESGFHILRSTASSAQANAYTVVGSVPAGTTTFTETGLAPGTKVHHRVQAYNAGGAGDLSEPLTTSTLATEQEIPARPQDLIGSASGATSLLLRWSDFSGNEDGFILRLADEAGTFSEVARVGPNITTFLLENLAPDARSYLEVSAYNAHGESVATSLIATLGDPTGAFAELTTQGNGLVYGLSQNPYRIERYHLDTRQWLAPWLIPGRATAMASRGSDLYVAIGSEMYRLAGNGSFSHLANIANSIAEIHALDGALLHRNAGGSVFYRMDRFTGADLGSFDPTTTSSIHSLSLTSDRRHLYGSVSGSTLIHLEVSTTGALLSQSYPPVESAMERSGGSQLMPGESAIAFGSGAVFSLSDFSYQGTLTRSTDMAFAGNTPILLDQRQVIASGLSPFTESGVALLSAQGKDLAVNGTDAIAFVSTVSGSRGLAPVVIPLHDLLPRPPVAPIAPEGFDYTLDNAFVDETGIVWLFSAFDAQLFRWNTQTRTWLDTVPLPRYPVSVAHWPGQAKVAIIDDRGVIRTHPTGGGAPVATQPLANAHSLSVLAFDQRLGALGSVNTSYDAGGNVLHAASGSGDRQVWDPVHQRILSMENNSTLAALPVDASGRFGTKVTAPVATITTGTPIRLRPDGQQLVLTRTGQILDPATLQPVANLNRFFLDVTWIGTTMFSILGSPDHSPEGQTRVVAHGPAGEDLADLYLPGSPRRMMARGNELVVITTKSGVPRLFVLSPALAPLGDSTPTDLPYFSVQPLQRIAEVGASVTLEIRAVGAFPLSYQWFRGTTLLNDETGPTLTLSGLGAQDSGDYTVRVTNPNGHVFSNPANVAVGALAQQFLEPGNLLVRRTFTVSEFATGNDVRQSLVVPFSGVGTSNPGDLVVDRFGRLHFHTVRTNGAGILSTYHGNGSAWMPFEETFSTSQATADRDLTIIGDSLVGRAAAFGVLYWASTPVTTAVPGGIGEISAGLDGKVYALALASPRTQIYVLDPATFAITTTIPVAATTTSNPQAITADFDGNILLGRKNGAIDKLAPNGNLLASLSAGNLDLTDLSISADGRVAAGTVSGTVIVTSLSLAAFTILDAPGSGASYTTWVPSATRLTGNPSPVFDPTTGLFRQQVTITNKGNIPLHALEIRVAGLPASVRLYNGSGSNHIRLPANLLPGQSAQLFLEYLSANGAGQAPFIPVIQILPDSQVPAVQPGIFAIREVSLSSDGRVAVTFPAEPGIRYQLERSTAGSTWVPAGLPFRAAGSSAYWIDDTPASGQPRPLLLRARRLGP